MVSPATETNGRFSPDGKWVAYQSNESGGFEVYVKSHPASSGRVQISADGGTKPVWSPDGNHIYFIEGRKVMMATVKHDPSLRVVSRQTLFEGDYLQE